MPLLMGLIAAMGWGLADFLAGSAVSLAGVRRTALFQQTICWILLSLVLMSMPTARAAALHAGGWGWASALLAMALNLVASLALLRAFSLGRASVIAPLITSYAAVTACLDLASGASFGSIGLLGIGACLVGAPLAAARADDELSSRRDGIGYAAVTALCLGLSFWIQGHFAIPMLGFLPMLWLLFGSGLVVIAPILLIKREPLFPPRSALPVLIALSLSNLVGHAGFAVGMATGAVTVVTVSSTFAAAVTALLGLGLRGERLTLPQGVGAITVLCGALLLHLGT
ncbi:DMT family transporter [Novosphingobium terrae]|uniref:DMT family transporter n=1 Tax=Novosphingobium terrae TaxID=2726189 RepID=UPI001F1341E8|nr:DMT family transporter [Novosphingobium terrae]